MKVFFGRRSLVIMAIVLMVVSGLMSHFIVLANDRHIVQLRHSKQQAEETIRNLWENASQAERNADAAVMVALLARTEGGEAMLLRQYYMSRAGEGMEQTAQPLLDMLRRNDATHQQVVDRINDTYISVANTEGDIDTLEQHNETIAHFAFFLQLLSLMLILLTREIPHG